MKPQPQPCSLDPPVSGEPGHRPKPGWRLVFQQQLKPHSGDLSYFTEGECWLCPSCDVLFYSFDRGALWGWSHCRSMWYGGGTVSGTSLPRGSHLPSPRGVPQGPYPFLPSPSVVARVCLKCGDDAHNPQLRAPRDASMERFEAAELGHLLLWPGQPS